MVKWSARDSDRIYTQNLSLLLSVSFLGFPLRIPSAEVALGSVFCFSKLVRLWVSEFLLPLWYRVGLDVGLRAINNKNIV